MRKLSRQQIDGLHETAKARELWPYAIVDGLKSITRSSTAESLERRGLLNGYGRGLMRYFTITDEGRAAIAALAKARGE